ncbi:cytochrome P450 [Cunninghamella echinulata]|nr:cytochrome P450 [Cunninghamella echinulata]
MSAVSGLADYIVKHPLSSYTYGSLAAAGVFACLYPDRTIFTEKRQNLTAPRAWPLIGSFPSLLQWVTHVHEAFISGFDEVGKQTYLLNAICIPQMIITNDPANVEHILKRPNFSAAMDELFGHGIFNANGEEWKFQRKTASHVFNVKNFRDQFTDVFIEEIDYLTTHILDKAAEENKVIDFHDLMFKFTLDSFILLGFGVHLNALKQEEKVPFAAAFDDAQKGTFFRMINQFWPRTEPLTRLLGPVWIPNMPKSVKIVDEYARHVINQRREQIANGEEHKDLLSRFITASNADGQPLSDDELRDIVLNFVIAGRDTTAQALSWCFYQLSLHPRVERRLIDEIDQYITDDLFTDSPAMYEVIKSNMVYTHAVFYETLRLYPSVPLNQKYALKDDIWPDGTHIKKGDYVVWTPYAQGRSEKVWGPDAKHFKPERWITPEGELRRESQGKWPAFHAGPRVCLGQHLATLEALVAIIAILRKYKFTLQPGQDVTYQISLTLPMKHGVKFTVEHRQKK